MLGEGDTALLRDVSRMGSEAFDRSVRGIGAPGGQPPEPPNDQPVGRSLGASRWLPRGWR